MTERWLIIGTDERMKFLAKQLSSDLRTVYYKNSDTYTYNNVKRILKNSFNIELDKLLNEGDINESF